MAITNAEIARIFEDIATVNREQGGIAVLSGIEVDILEDGTLDLPDAILSRLDIVVAAVHSLFSLPRDVQTARILKALDNPFVRVLAHPSGRLLETREPYDVGMHQIVNLRFGVGQARRGWLTTDQIANTRTLPALRKMLGRTRGATRIEA